jgi:hypothetical protein
LLDLLVWTFRSVAAQGLLQYGLVNTTEAANLSRPKMTPAKLRWLWNGGKPETNVDDLC